MKKAKVAMLLLGLMAVLLIGCKKKIVEETELETAEVIIETETEKITETETEKITIEETETETETENTEGMVQSYLTGKWVDESIGNHRPIAVMLGNSLEALPQAGIANADVIYEAPVEGNYTRLMAIFEDYQNLEKIGSVRSCRNYYVYYAREFDAVYLHYGQAVYALPLLGMYETHNLSGLEAIGSTVYYRTADRYAPHNAYASAFGIESAMDIMGYRSEYSEYYTGHYRFAEKDEMIELEDGYGATYIELGYTINNPWFEYDEATGLYTRFQYGAEQIDELTGEALQYKNIIIQYSWWQNFDENGYLNIDTIYGGTGDFITNGKAIAVTWEKDSEFGPTRYYNAITGEEITLNQGKTWVCIVQDSYEYRVVINAE
jgi:Protein of unknown function (DUF3048).